MEKWQDESKSRMQKLFSLSQRQGGLESEIQELYEIIKKVKEGKGDSPYTIDSLEKQFKDLKAEQEKLAQEQRDIESS